MWFKNNSGSEFANNQTDGFLSNLLNDEDLQLMDMAMNEGKSSYFFQILKIVGTYIFF